MNGKETIKEQLIAAGCRLLDQELIIGTWGNLSCRIDGSKEIAVTPSGRCYRSLTAADISTVNIDNGVVRGRLKPTSELALHLAVYRNRADVHAVIHTHSIFATAFAVARKPILAVVEDIAQVVGGSVDVALYAPSGTEALGCNAAAALGGKNAVLLANHGLLCCGRTLNEAMIACQLVEKTAQILIHAGQIATPHVLPAEEVAAMHLFYQQDYSKRAGGQADE